MKKTFPPLLIILSMVITFVIIEVGYQTYLKVVKPVTIYKPGAKVLNPNGKGMYRGGYVSLDQYALRNTTEILEKEIKFLVVGDSLTFGSGVNDDEVFVHSLNKASKNYDIGFINLGRPGHDTFLLVRHFLEYESVFDPYDAIIWVYYINDAKSSVTYIPWHEVNSSEPYSKGPYEIENQLWPHLKSPTLIKHLLQKTFAKSSNKEPSQEYRSNWESYYKLCLESYESDSETAKNEEKYIKDIIKYSRIIGVPLIFVLAPATDQLRDRNFTPQIFIKNILDKYKVPVLDLIPVLEKTKNIEDYYLTDDHAHWNAKGHTLVAEEIKEFINNVITEQNQ